MLSHTQSVSRGLTPILSPYLEGLSSSHSSNYSGLQMYLPIIPVLLSMGLVANGALLNASCTSTEILISLVMLCITMIYYCLIFGICCYHHSCPLFQAFVSYQCLHMCHWHCHPNLCLENCLTIP